MKCGEIWARSALISASISRVRDWSRSASSSWTRDPAGHLAGGADQDRRLAGRAGDEGAVDPVVDGERGDDGPAHRAVRGVAGQREGLAAAGVQRAREAFHDLGAVVVADAVPDQDLFLVGEAERVGAEQGAQPAGGLAGGLLGEPGPQRGRGERGGVQGLEGGVFDGGAEAAEVLRGGRCAGRARSRRRAAGGSPRTGRRGSRSRLHLRPQFLRQMEAGQDRAPCPRGTRPGVARDTSIIVRKPSGTDQSGGPGEQGVQRARAGEAGHGRGDGQRTRSRRRPACPAAAPGGVSRRHQMPRTSSGQKEEADTAKARPTASATGSPPTSTLAASGTAMARTVPSRKCRTPRVGQDVLGEHARHGHGQPGGRGQERGEGPARDQRAEQVAAEAADHPLGQQQDGGVGVAGEGEFGGVEPAEGAVDGRQEVEGADQAEHGDRGAAGGDCRAGWCRSGRRRAAGPWCRGRWRGSVRTWRTAGVPRGSRRGRSTCRRCCRGRLPGRWCPRRR